MSPDRQSTTPERVMTVTARVQKHREKLRGDHCQRLEVWVGRDWIRSARLIAKWQKRPFWKLVQDALKAYVAQNAIIIKPLKDRDR